MDSHGGDPPPPALPSWGSTILIVLGGTIVAWVAVAVVVLPLSVLHVVPLNSEDLPGTGWPWRIDGLWAFCADLGPVLAAGFAFAAATGFYLRRQTGVPPRRWPLALLAATVGWIPIVGSRPGLIGVGGGLAFAVMVWATRRWSLHERKPTRLSTIQLAGIVALGLALSAGSFSYGALHPLAVDSIDDGRVRLHGGRAALALNLDNAGPFAARVRDIRLVGAEGLRIEGLQTNGGSATAPTPEGLVDPLGAPTLEPGEEGLRFYLVIRSDGCGRSVTSVSWTIDELDNRLRTAGVERTQRVALATAMRAHCRTE